jgi:hypothetical protein
MSLTQQRHVDGRVSGTLPEMLPVHHRLKVGGIYSEGNVVSHGHRAVGSRPLVFGLTSVAV